MQRYPLTAAARARPTPVLPAVASMIVPPGCSQPAPLGLLDHGHADAVLDAAAGIERLELDQDRGRTRPVASRCSGIKGVRPIADRIEGVIPSADGPSVSNSLGWNSTSSSVPIPIATSHRIPAIDPVVRPPALHHSSANPLSIVSIVSRSS